MAGLRLVNNNFVPYGDGRDLMVFYDSSFRGGKLCQESVLTHFPNPKAGVPKLFKSPKKGFGARVEADTQHLNCARNMNTYLAETKAKLAEAKKTSKLPRRIALGASDDNLPEMLRSRSDPGLDGLTPFSRSTGMAATTSAACLRRPSSAPCGSFATETLQMPSPSPEATARGKTPRWTNNLARTSYSGIARTPYGGFWPMC
jgi:hypothetical protein